jgi:hypothetical protein
MESLFGANSAGFRRGGPFFKGQEFEAVLFFKFGLADRQLGKFAES